MQTHTVSHCVTLCQLQDTLETETGHYQSGSWRWCNELHAAECDNQSLYYL